MYQLIKLKKITDMLFTSLMSYFLGMLLRYIPNGLKKLPIATFITYVTFFNSTSAVLLFYFLKFKIFSVSALNMSIA
jgi:hypothetical protein